MLKKFLVTASVAALAAGSASALEVRNRSVGADAAGEVVVLAQELNYAGTPGIVSVQGADNVTVGDGQTEVTFYPTAGLFPTGNVLVYVDVTGATFANVLNGSEVDGTGTSVISSGGQAGASSVVFLVSGADACTAAGICSIDLPLKLTGTDVSFSVGLKTDAGAPVDNSSDTLRKTAQVVEVQPAFAISFDPDTVANVALLSSLFTTLSDDYLGDIVAAVNTFTIGANDRIVNKTLGGVDVLSADVLAANITLSGNMDAFEGGDVTFDGASADAIDAVADTATYDALGLGTFPVVMVPDTTTAIARSSYSASVEIVPQVASGLQGTTTASGSLQPIVRDGTSITFPWTQSATQGGASGASSVFRIGNLDNVDAGAVFVEVKNASEPGYSNPGIVSLATSIGASGELVKNSADIEAAVGNYGRGDLEFTIEADPDTLTARQFVIRNGVIQQVIGGNVSQDLN